jgi:hypothetical protein
MRAAQRRDALCDPAHAANRRTATIDHMMSSFAVAAPYAALHAYLKGRYADRVVLTFSEIEDLLGFALPDRARANPEWWSNDDGENPSPQSLMWIKASRRATPNLFARTVAFERVGI